MQYVKGALTEKMHRASRTAVGFILADTEWKPLYANAEAKKIVTYPEAPRRFQSAWALMGKRIFALTGKQNSSFASTSHVEFLSGRRKYVGLAIPLAKWRRPPAAAAVAVVLERSGAASWGAAEVSESFRLTERERERLHARQVTGLARSLLAVMTWRYDTMTTRPSVWSAWNASSTCTTAPR